MSTRVYLSKNPCQTTQEEHTPVCIRIQASHATVKALQARLQDAYRRDDVRVVRRIRVLLELLTQTASVTVLCERWGLSPACLYAWQKAFMLRGMDSLVYRHSGGRPEQLTPRQKKRLVELIEAGPMVVGFETACWHSVLIRVLIWREFGVLFNRHYVCALLHNMGFSFQKARLALVQLNGDNFLFYNKSLGDLNVEKFTHKHPRSVDGVNDVWHAYPHSSRNLHDIGIARKLDWRLYKRLF